MQNSSPHRVWRYKKSFGARLTMEDPFAGSAPISSGAAKRMTLLRFALALVLTMAIGAPAYSDQASAADGRGVRAEAVPGYDAAFIGYAEANRLKPNVTT